MKISIIIPVYNVAPYIGDCLKSVMAQTYDGDTECIIVDDCGTDNSIAICEQLIIEYTGNIDFLIVHQNQNGGAAAARNAGLEIASGDYIFFVDSDDFLASNCLESLVAPLKNEKYDIVVGNYKTIANGEVLPYSNMNLKLEDGIVLYGKSIIRQYRKSWNMVVWDKLVKASLIKNEGLFFKNGLIFEDELWCFELACVAKTLFAVNKPVYYYVKHSDSISKSPFYRKQNRSWLEIVKEMGVFVRKKGLYNKYIHLRLNSFFFRIMNDNSASLSNYVKIYKDMTVSLKPTRVQLIKAIGWDLRWYLMDLHYLLPKSIAPYWMYYTFTKPYMFIKGLKK